MEQKKSIWDECTNLYSLQKTLRFELVPVGRTREHINQKRLIEEDEELAKKFNDAKKIMDDYYKFFIEDRLKKVRIEEANLKEFEKIYRDLKKDRSKDKKKRDEFSKIQKKIRNDIHKKLFEDTPEKSFGKDFLTKTLPEWLKSNNREKDSSTIKDFQRWTTYFKGFFKNRENVFSKDDIHTSFIYRIVHDNLPKYIDNLDRYDTLKRYSDFKDEQLCKSFSSELKGQTLSEFFIVENFNECLNQSGIERFNLIIGGKSLDDNKKIQGINETINLYSQRKTYEEKREVRRLFMLPLFKQILSDRTSSSFVLSAIKDDAEVISYINDFYSIISNYFELLQTVFKQLFEFNTKQIYIHKASLNDVSRQIYDDWMILETGLKFFAKEKLKLTTEKKIEEWFKKTAYFSLDEIKQSIEYLQSENVDPKKVVEYHKTITRDNKPIIDAIKADYVAVKELNLNKGERKLLTEQREEDVTKIKQFLDSVMNLYHFLKPFSVGVDADSETGSFAVEVDAEFYKDFSEIYARLAEVVPLYNKVRNYITQKPFSRNKFKLNFNESALLDGWDKNKEHDKNYSFIFRENDSFFLGITSTDEDTNILREDIHPEIFVEDSFFRKMVCKDLGDIKRQLPRMGFSNKAKTGVEVIGWNQDIEDIKKDFDEFQEKKKNDKKLWGENFDRNKLVKLIDYYKSVLKNHSEKYEETNNITYKPTADYRNLGDFFDHVQSQTYKVTFVGIDKDYIDALASEGKLYLFQIWNKDFSPLSKGRKNLHTLYWQELFSPKNLSDVRFKLNGKAEVFFRRKSIAPIITHPKNKPITNKNPIRGKKERTLSYDLIKDRRYTEDKFFFHCPITLNFKSSGSDNNKYINLKINDIIKKNPDVNILSIDRGERHLLYYTLLNSKGEIREQKSLNTVFDDVQREHSYHDKLNTLEVERQAARKAWKTIRNIKELKSGYLSQVVHKICKLAIDHNAIIVLEDLNSGFKRERFKVEKQVYQKFEKTLIDKMNFLVFKERPHNIPGGVLYAYQLTSKFDTFKKMRKQTGLLYYVDARYTSKICPKTGFVNLLYPKYTNVSAAQNFFRNFESITYNTKEKYFEFKFRYSKFISEQKPSARKNSDLPNNYYQKEWTVCSFGNRLVPKRSSKNIVEILDLNPTQELNNLFTENHISFDDGKNLIESISTNEHKDFFKRLLDYLKYTLQSRNTNKKSGDDFILSCVKDNSGEFFDSRKPKNGCPENADANGAYHIGLKGLLAIKKIKSGDTNLFVDKHEYLDFVANKT